MGIIDQLIGLLDPPQISADDVFDEIDWHPQPKQALAEEMVGQVAEFLYGGAAGGGKSDWLLAHAISEMMRHPRNHGLILRRVMPALNRSLLPRALAVLNDHARYNGQEHTFRFDNGSVLEFSHLEREESVRRYQGAEYGFIGFEEVTEFLEPQWDFLRSRARSPADGIRPHMAATTNPGGVGHRWVKRRWVAPKPEDVEPGSPPPAPGQVWLAKSPTMGEPPTRRLFLPATLDDNPILTTRDPAYVSTLRANPNRAMRLALELGDWDAIDQIEGALWAWPDIDDHRREQGWLQPTSGSGGLVQIAVAVDPATTSGPDADDTGIVVVGRGMDREFYVLADRTCHKSPDGWARQAIEAYREFEADVIVAEGNQGGQMVEHTLRTIDPRVPVRRVTATRGKRLRAEPIAALYEQHRVHHVGTFPELEEQMTSWTPESGDSPDRLDALVWALTELTDPVAEPATTSVPARNVLHRR